MHNGSKNRLCHVVCDISYAAATQKERSLPKIMRNADTIVDDDGGMIVGYR